jgi:competence protein ComGC
MKTEQNKTIRPSPTGSGGFTLTDLVVLLGVVAVLILVEAPALAVSRGQTKMGVCASHVRQIALACQIYANENNNRLPVLSGSANWAWDLPVNVANALLRSGVTTNGFYCPGTSPRFTDSDNWMALGSSSLWNFGAGGGVSGFHIIGYSLAFSGSSIMSSGTISATNQNTTMLPEMIKNGSTYLPAPAASDRVLVADATISDNLVLPGYAHPDNNYTTIQGGFYKSHVSPHLNGNIPAGGNVGFKDGHVAWRKFELMVPRTTSGRYFWW